MKPWIFLACFLGLVPSVLAKSYVGWAAAGGTDSDFTLDLRTFQGGKGGTLKKDYVVILVTGCRAKGQAEMSTKTAGYVPVGSHYTKSLSYHQNLSASWKVMGDVPDVSVTCPGSGDAKSPAFCIAHVWEKLAVGESLDLDVFVSHAFKKLGPADPLDVLALVAQGTPSGEPCKDDPCVNIKMVMKGLDGYSKESPAFWLDASKYGDSKDLVGASFLMKPKAVGEKETFELTPVGVVASPK